MSDIPDGGEEVKAYYDWIAEHVKGTGYGRCVETCAAMQEAFPLELREARGFYHDPVWGRRTHAWLVAADGSIVDPTAKQFPCGGIADLYEEVQQEEMEDRIPTGVCQHCGCDVYRGDLHCSPACAEEAAREIEVQIQNCGWR